jgi:hypothetical protein
MDINDVLAVVNNERATSLGLSKGGWEGWLQCELWRHLTLKGESAEREFPYPGSAQRSDLVVNVNGQLPLWVEIKAFGVFREGDADRFLDGIGLDVMKLGARPDGTDGLMLVVVPKAIGDALTTAFVARQWHGFTRTDAAYLAIYHMTF